MRKSILLLTLATFISLFSKAAMATTYAVYCDGRFYYSSSDVGGVNWAISVCRRNNGTPAVFRRA